MDKLKIESLKRTCIACPAQWEGKLVDGRMFYIRYRWGYLSVRISDNPTNQVGNAVRGEEILGINHGGGYDGDMEEGEMLELINGVME